MDIISPGGAVPEKPAKMFEFKRVTLRVSGMMASATEYEALKTAQGVEVSCYDGPLVYHEGTSRESCLKVRKKGRDTLYYELAEFFDKIEIEKWDGFSKSNSMVLDGYSFSFEAETVNGKTIYAHGNNSYPPHYGEFVNYLQDILY